MCVIMNIHRNWGEIERDADKAAMKCSQYITTILLLHAMFYMIFAKSFFTNLSYSDLSGKGPHVLE